MGELLTVKVNNEKLRLGNFMFLENLYVLQYYRTAGKVGMELKERWRSGGWFQHCHS